MAYGFKDAAALLPAELFTRGEERIAVRLLCGESRPEIAKDLRISENTVKTHSHRIFVKSKVGTQKEFMVKYLLKK